MKIEQDLQIEVVSKEELDPKAWDKASDIVADCLLSLLRIKVQDNDQPDKGLKSGFD